MYSKKFQVKQGNAKEKKENLNRCDGDRVEEGGCGVKVHGLKVDMTGIRVTEPLLDRSEVKTHLLSSLCVGSSKEI